MCSMVPMASTSSPARSRYSRVDAMGLHENIETVLELDMVVSMDPTIMLPEGMPGAGG